MAGWRLPVCAATAWRFANATGSPNYRTSFSRIPAVTNTVEEMLATGQAEFAIGGQTFRLEPVIEEDHLFYIFKDRTAGKTTYAAGRFMELPMPKDGVAIVDFNRAYNPPCAFPLLPPAHCRSSKINCRWRSRRVSMRTISID